MTVTAAPNPAPTAMSGPAVLSGASWFDRNWMFIGSFFFPIALLVPFLPFLYTRPSIKLAFQDALRSPYVLGWLTVPFYLCHQTEEHAYDLRGWRYAFVPNFNHSVGALLFSECERLGHLRCPLTPRITSEVNVACVWLGFVVTMILAQYLRGPYAYAGICNWGMCVVNAFGGHLLPWLFMGYNPGAFQSLFQFGFGVWAMLTCPGGCRFAAVALLDGVLFHVIVFGVGTNLNLKLGWPVEIVGFLSFIFSTALPLALARFCAPKVQYDKIKESADDVDDEGSA